MERGERERDRVVGSREHAHPIGTRCPGVRGGCSIPTPSAVAAGMSEPRPTKLKVTNMWHSLRLTRRKLELQLGIGDFLIILRR